MADKFSVYSPPSLAYVGFGISEGLRKHMEYMQQQRREEERTRQFNEQLAFQRQSAETEAMQRANELAAREKSFNTAAATDAAKLDLEKEKFKQDKKQWAMEYPTRMEFLRKSGEAKTDTAEASITKAQAAKTAAGAKAAGKSPFTISGLTKQYADIWNDQFSEAVKTSSKDFTNIYDDPVALEETKKKATAATRVAMTPALNAYNEYVDANPLAVGQSRMDWNDLEALPELDKRKTGGAAGEAATKKLTQEWSAMNADKTFNSRFKSVDLTDREIDLLRINAKDLYEKYIELTKKKGSSKLGQKMSQADQDERDAAAQQRDNR